jgi:hypothetical protein
LNPAPLKIILRRFSALIKFSIKLQVYAVSFVEKSVFNISLSGKAKTFIAPSRVPTIAQNKSAVIPVANDRNCVSAAHRTGLSTTPKGVLVRHHKGGLAFRGIKNYKITANYSFTIINNSGTSLTQKKAIRRENETRRGLTKDLIS